MTNTPFNSPGSFDLGKLKNISFLSDNSISDKVLALKHDTETGKYYLSPQNQLELDQQYRDEIIIGTGNSYFHKSTFIASTNSDNYKILKTYTITVPENAADRKKIYISLNIDLYGNENTTNSSNFYNFTTGYNVMSSSAVIPLAAAGTGLPTCVAGGLPNWSFNGTTWTRNCCFLGSVWGYGGCSGDGIGLDDFCKGSSLTPDGRTSFSNANCCDCPGSDCSGSPPTWSCDGAGGCYSNPTSGSYFTEAICQTNCPVPRWTCSGSPSYTCTSGSTGAYATSAECVSACKAPKWTCNANFTCTSGVTGPYTTQALCMTACVAAPVLWNCSGSPGYSCTSGTTGTYATQQLCTDACKAPPPVKWNCSGSPNYLCTSGTTGAFDTESACVSACHAPRWTCVGNTSCTSGTTGAYSSQAQCLAACVPVPVLWNCSGSPGYSCTSGTTGTYTTQQLCTDACKPPPPPTRYKCISAPTSDCIGATSCVLDYAGTYTTLGDCELQCGNIPVNENSDYSEIGTINTYPVWSNNLPATDLTRMTYNYTHIPGNFAILMYNSLHGNDTPVMFGSENHHPYYEDVISNKQNSKVKINEYTNNILVLQPNFATMRNPIYQGKFNIKNYPRVTSHINSNGDLVLTIEAKSVQYSNENINWFCKTELFVSIT